QERFDRAGLKLFPIRVMQARHRIRRQMRGERLESDDRRSVRSRFGDVVVRRLPSSTASGDELEEIAVQLQHEIRRERHVREVRVDGVQDIAITGDLLFGAVCRLCPFGNEVADALRRRHDAFDSIRRLGALNDSALPERLEYLRRLLLEEGLFTAVLPDEPYALQ